MRQHYYYIIYGMTFLAYILNIFIQSSFIHIIISWASFFILLLSFRYASRLFKVMGTLFAISGVVMSLSSGISWHKVPEQFTDNIPILIFLSMLPWIASAFSVGEYDDNLKDMIDTKNNRLSGMYGRSLGTTYSLLIFINISAIYLVQQILIDKLKKINKVVRNDFIIQVTLRAFALTVIWSPMEIIVGITVDATNVSFLSYFPWLLFISFTLATIDILITKRKFSEYEIISTSKINEKELFKSLMKLSFVLFSFFTIIIVGNNLTGLNFILTVSFVILPFTFIWSLFMKRPISFLKTGWVNWKNYNNSMQNFVVLILSLALFSQGFNQTVIPQMLQEGFDLISNYTVLIFIFMTVIYFVMGMIGIHPVATIAILIEVITPLFSVINPMSIGIVLIVSALATTASAPYGINATLTTQTIGVSPYYITKKNFPFSIMMSAMGILIAMLLL